MNKGIIRTIILGMIPGILLSSIPVSVYGNTKNYAYISEKSSENNYDFEEDFKKIDDEESYESSETCNSSNKTEINWTDANTTETIEKNLTEIEAGDKEITEAEVTEIEAGDKKISETEENDEKDKLDSILSEEDEIAGKIDETVGDITSGDIDFSKAVAEYKRIAQDEMLMALVCSAEAVPVYALKESEVIDERTKDGERVEADSKNERTKDGERVEADSENERTKDGERVEADSENERTKDGERVEADTESERTTDGERVEADTESERTTDSERDKADSESEYTIDLDRVVSYLESGYTVYPQDVLVLANSGDYSIYYLVKYYEDENECEGLIDARFLAYSNELWISWEQEYLSDIRGLVKVSASSGIYQRTDGEEFLEGELLYGEENIEAYSDIEIFPGSYHAALLSIKSKHPNWTFVPVNTKLDFDSAVSNEMGDKSWIYINDENKRNGYVGSATGQTNWSYATRSGVSHYMDPRTYLDETHIFAFEQLTYNSSYHTEDAVQSFLSRTFMKGIIPDDNDSRTYANAFYTIGKSRKLSPTHLASRVIQEQGSGTSPLISGTYPGYIGYYNYFNIGATGSTSNQVIVNGLTYARNKGWNTRYKSLEGGAASIGNNYLLKGQDTIYLQKYNVAPGAANAVYTHQYMQNIQAPYTEATSTYKIYNGAGSLNSSFVFKIPVYNNMPSNGDILINQVTITNKEDAQNLLKGQSVTLGLEYSPKDTSELADVKWTSSNTTVASVDNGVVKAISKGSCKITAIMGKSQVSDSVNITVSTCTITFLKADGRTHSTKETSFGYKLNASDFPSESELAQTDSSAVLIGWYEVVEREDGSSGLGARYTEGSIIRDKAIRLKPYYEKTGQGFYVEPIGSVSYTGKAIKPEVKVYDSNYYIDENGSGRIDNKELVLGTDYTVTYKNNTNAGSATNPTISKRPTVTVKGKGNYAGSQNAYFDIIPKSLKDENVSVTNAVVAFSGREIKGSPEVYVAGVKLKKGTDYTLTYPVTGSGSYTNIGKWPVIITGKGGYTGSITAYEEITGKVLISKVSYDKVPNQLYDSAKVNQAAGKGMEPEIILRYAGNILRKSSDSRGLDGDYTITYENNTAVGTGRAVIKATANGNFAGSRVICFKITGTPMSSVNMRARSGQGDAAVIDKDYSINEKEMQQALYELYYGDKILTESIDGKSGDYTVSYKNADKAGTATVIFTGINGYTGSIKKNYRIRQIDLANDSNVSATVQTVYSYAQGGVKALPQVTLRHRRSGETKMLIAGVDYTLSYKNNNALNNGENESKLPTVTIKGKGNFKGSLALDYRIIQRDFASFVQKGSPEDNGSKGTISAADVNYNLSKNGFKSVPVITDYNGVRLRAGKDYKKDYIYTYVDDVDLDKDGIIDRRRNQAIQEADVLPVGTRVRVSVEGIGGSGNYSGSQCSCVYRIAKLQISDSAVKVIVDPAEYSGRTVRPTYSSIHISNRGVNLRDNVDYEIIAYGENIKKGKGSIVIRGLGDYGGNRTITFTIKFKGIFW